jgi:hypothetical protein
VSLQTTTKRKKGRKQTNAQKMREKKRRQIKTMHNLIAHQVTRMKTN